MYVCMCVYIYMSTHPNIQKCLRMHVCMCVYTCMYPYIYLSVKREKEYARERKREIEEEHRYIERERVAETEVYKHNTQKQKQLQIHTHIFTHTFARNFKSIRKRRCPGCGGLLVLKAPNFSTTLVQKQLNSRNSLIDLASQ